MQKFLHFFMIYYILREKKNFALVYFQCQSIVEGGIKNINKKCNNGREYFLLILLSFILIFFFLKDMSLKRTPLPLRKIEKK